MNIITTTMIKLKTYRQGDVLLVPVNEIPKTANKIAHRHQRLILAQGEATGHHHSIACSPNVELLQIPSQNDLFLLVKEGDALLEHQEHATVTVPAGVYRVVIQREYDPSGELRVSD